MMGRLGQDAEEEEDYTPFGAASSAGDNLSGGGDDIFADMFANFI
jgi:hypothetical protein